MIHGRSSTRRAPTFATFDKGVAESATPEEVIDKMMQLHGERGNPFSLWVAADGVREQLGRVSLSV